MNSYYYSESTLSESLSKIATNILIVITKLNLVNMLTSSTFPLLFVITLDRQAIIDLAHIY